MQTLNQQTAIKTNRPEKIVQFGEGNFLRGFADWIVSIMNERTDFNGSAVVVQPTPRGRVDRLERQDCLYHVNLQGHEGGKVVDSFRLIDTVSRCVNPYARFDDYLKLAEQPEMRFIISNTTEAGIAFDPACRFSDCPALSYPGKLTQLLYHRFCHFGNDPQRGFVILPCELIAHNGRKLEETVMQYADLWQLGTDFEAWLHNACVFCSTLVDRIVPGYPERDINRIKAKLQYDDNLLVQGEVYHLWVIEAPESVGREFPAPACGLNVKFVNDEQPYHQRKVTLLNGPHTLLSPVAYLSGVDIVRDACHDPLVGRYIRRVMYEELLETLDLPKTELLEFADSVMERFTNPYIDHKVTSIMLNAFSKFASRDLPALKEFCRRKGKLPQGIVFGLAALITYYKGGQRSDGAAIEPNDAHEVTSLLRSLWASGSASQVAAGVLSARELWGEDLRQMEGLEDLLAQHISAIGSLGMRDALKTFLK